MDYFQLMKASCEDVNLTLDETKFNGFVTYMKLLQDWNEKINLTSIIEDEQIIKKHFIDCIKIFKLKEITNSLVPSGDKAKRKRIIDIGTGAGFPGIPMKIMVPELNIVLLDSLNKRINFLNEVINTLNLQDISAIHGRAEDFARDNFYRNNFDFAVSRAVANLAVLSELSLPYVKVGGYFIAMKGPSVEEEIINSKNALDRLGGKIEEIIKVDIEDTDLKHNIVVIKKFKATSNLYPRKAGLINKNPL
ncbi:MAG: 16S rRNA (guanine(527)-N(7))-methyltransferase RsmG [Clostridiaceae bacterium]|nr:16S rRNA (guanine(527)-N(7))-methyltransferase RsmG [Clostridiaceae bacterium]